MPLFISEYRKRKLVEYLRPGMKVLLDFVHGLGDTMMFMPILYKMRELYPTTQIDIHLECDQDMLFESVVDKTGFGYDIVFGIHFPMSEGSGITKQAACCIQEIGIDPVIDFAPLPMYESPLVAVHYQGTALPESVNCPESIAEKVWNEIIKVGLIPIECHFQHVFHNAKNGKYPFIDNNVRNCQANLRSLVGLLQHCFAFVGVASGPFTVAMSVLPLGRVFYLENRHTVETYVDPFISSDVNHINVNQYVDSTIFNWLEDLK